MSREIQRAIFSILGGLGFFVCCVGIGQSQVPGAGREYAINGSVRSEENDSPIPQVRVELRTDAGNTAHPSSSPTAAANLSSDNFDRASTTLLQNSTAITLRAFAWILLGTTKSI